MKGFNTKNIAFKIILALTTFFVAFVINTGFKMDPNGYVQLGTNAVIIMVFFFLMEKVDDFVANRKNK